MGEWLLSRRDSTMVARHEVASDSTGITPLLRYYGGSVTSRAQFFGPSIDH